LTQSKEFTLTFYSPASGTSINLAWDAVFDNGTPPGGSNGDSGNTSIALAAIDPTSVTSAVPPNETVSVFTGNLALPSAADQFTVAISVPSANSTSTTATVVESDITSEVNCRSLRNFVRCFQSDISIPGVVLSGTGTDYLTFQLRVDKSDIRNGAKIDKVVITYTDDSQSVPIVQYCLKDGNGNPIVNVTQPCIARADDYTRKSPLGWKGFQWTIITIKNGKLGIF
jgi:hypothetical protein